MAELMRACLGCGRPFAPVRARQTCCRPSCQARAVWRRAEARRARHARPLLDLAERADPAPAIATPAPTEDAEPIELTDEEALGF